MAAHGGHNFQGANIDGNAKVHFGDNHYAQPGPAEEPPAPLSTVPFRRDPNYVQREPLAEELDRKLSVPGAAVALVGLGGVGKSQLAIEHTYRVRDASKSTWVLWIHSSNAARFEQSVRNNLDDLKVPGRKDPQADIFQLFRGWLQDEQKGKWLLVLDNADDADFFLRKPSQTNKADSSDTTRRSGRGYLDYLPSSDHGAILVTSRNEASALQIVEERNIVSVQPMKEEEAVALLANKLTDQKGDLEQLEELAHSLDYVPLALAQAAAYIKQKAPRCSVRKYVRMLNKSDKSKKSLLNLNDGNLRRDQEAKNSIILTWQISFEHIASKRQSAADLLALMSFFDRQSIPEDVLRYGNQDEEEDVSYDDDTAEENWHSSDDNDATDWTSDATDDSDTTDESFDALSQEWDSDIQTLRDFSFISVIENGSNFTMHDLVRFSLHKWLETHASLDRWKSAFIKKMAKAFPRPDLNSGNWTECERLFPHASIAIDMEVANEEAIIFQGTLLHKSGWYALLKGRYANAQRMMERSLECRMNVLGEKHTQTLTSMANLAAIYREQGQLGKAEELCVRTLKTRRNILGESDPDTLLSEDDLVLIYADQEKWDEAKELSSRLLHKSREMLGENHPLTLGTIGNMAWIYHKQGLLEEAERLGVEFLNRNTKTFGRENLQTVESMMCLAAIRRAQKHWEDALRLANEALAIRRRLLGEAHPSTVSSMNEIASTYWAQGRVEEVKELISRILEMRKTVLGETHPDTLSSKANLVLFNLRSGHMKEAERLGQETLETSKHVLGEGHRITLAAMGNLAEVFRAQRKNDAVVDLLAACVAKSTETLGADHPDTTRRLRQLQEWRAETRMSEEGQRDGDVRPTHRRRISRFISSLLRRR
ncbi:hypothetical protein WHR41_00923 [Cladosporium halotolerans]|uniref:Kinesin light chain n=1 Tax=Cladosporium halotolerans TaxID=1052096 RepID=A0AB34KZM8_9PEZI